MSKIEMCFIYTGHFTLQRPSYPAAQRAHPGEPAGECIYLFNTLSAALVPISDHITYG